MMVVQCALPIEGHSCRGGTSSIAVSTASVIRAQQRPETAIMDHTVYAGRAIGGGGAILEMKTLLCLLLFRLHVAWE